VGTFPAVVAAIGTLAIPVIGVISSAIALGEPIGIDSIAALVLVLTSLTVVLIVPGLRRRWAGAAAR
jgi:drug/metabolite transporter (DMT)-like permease